jgi:Membrane protease subunits, stomatin/prohibitin homologs
MQATAVPPNATGERPGFYLSGPLVIVVEAILVLGALALILFQALARLANAETTGSPPVGLFGLLSGFALLLLALVILRGFRLMRRDQALVLFTGNTYLGTIRGGGLFWTNPFVSRRKLSLQAHQSTVQHAGDGSRSLTANVTWQVTDTAKALQLSDHYDEAVRQKIDQALADLGGSDDPARFQSLLEQRLGEIGASARQAELRSGRVAL